MGGKKVSKHRRQAHKHKISYDSEDAAWNAVRSLYRKFGWKLTVYKCRVGVGNGEASHWHTANVSPRSRRYRL